MAQPVWQTSSGHLGTVEEGKFFQVPLVAEDPDAGTVYYSLLSGELPDGVQITPSGTLSGIPEAVAKVKGVPSEVGENVTSEFAVRAYTKTSGGAVDRLNDRTFNITVTGQDIPEFVTAPGNIGQWYDGDRVSYQIEFTDDDPGDTVTVTVSSGDLPPGVEISTSGLISGWISTQSLLEDNAKVGWDGYNPISGISSKWDEYPWDFATRVINRNYQFTVKITDGKSYDLRTFSMFVFNKDSMTTDVSEITADTTYITADVVTDRTPQIRNYTTGVLDSYRHLNFYAYQFEGNDPDGDDYEFLVQSGDLPPGLDVDPYTGFLFGYIPSIGFRDITYNFVIRIRKVSSPLIYSDYSYSINIYGNIDTDVTWNVDANLGTIVNGEVSIFELSASHSQGYQLLYRLKPGSDSRLPRGLQLLESGRIIGRCSYQTFALDSGTTTFDSELRTRLDIDETTFDRTYTFTVQAFNDNEIINVEKTFTITVDRKYDKPCQCMRIEAFMPDASKDIIRDLVDNSDIFKPEWIYRNDDPWFGLHKKVWYEHAYGLEPATFLEYTNAIVNNHYRKKLVLGELKTARALDDDGNELYEVVYSTVVDTAVNKKGESAGLSQKLKYPINEDDSTEINTVYPNSLDNMRTRVISNVGQVAPILPRWMLSKQEDGRVLGFTRAWVVCYTVPGRSKQVKYNIEETYGTILNKVNFDADRYVLGWYAANHWNDTTGDWNASLMTTFDRETNSTYPNPSDETKFDGGSLRFITNIDKHEFTDAYDKYVLFPQQRIINNGE